MNGGGASHSLQLYYTVHPWLLPPIASDRWDLSLLLIHIFTCSIHVGLWWDTEQPTSPEPRTCAFCKALVKAVGVRNHSSLYNSLVPWDLSKQTWRQRSIFSANYFCCHPQPRSRSLFLCLPLSLSLCLFRLTLSHCNSAVSLSLLHSALPLLPLCMHNPLQRLMDTDMEFETLLIMANVSCVNDHWFRYRDTPSD